MPNFPLSQCRDKHIIEHADSIRWLSSNHPIDVPKVIESLNQSGYRVDKIDPTPQSIEFLDGISRGSTSVGSPVASYAIYSHDISSEVAQIHDFDGGDAPVASEQVSELLQQEPASNLGILVRLADGKLAAYTLAQHMRNQGGQGGTVVIAGTDKSGRTEARTCQNHSQLDQSAEANRATAQLEQSRTYRNQNAEALLLELGGNVQYFDMQAKGLAAGQDASIHQHRRVQGVSEIRDRLTALPQPPNEVQRGNNRLQIAWPGTLPREENQSSEEAVNELNRTGTESRITLFNRSSNRDLTALAQPSNEAQRGNNRLQIAWPGTLPREENQSSEEAANEPNRTGIEGWLTLFNRSSNRE